MYLSTTAGRHSKPLLGDVTTAGSPTLVRQLLCSDAQLAAISAVIGRPITRDEAREGITGAVGEAVRLATTSADLLDPSRRTSGVRAMFDNVFQVPPEHVPPWRPAGQTWTVGGVVRTRYREAARLLQGDSLHYSCWGYPWSGGAPDLPATYSVSAFANSRRIGLGKGFWLSWAKGDRVSMGANLLGAALRVYLDRFSFTEAAPRTIRAFCYMRFAIRASRLPIPGWIGDGCPQPPGRRTLGPEFPETGPERAEAPLVSPPPPARSGPSPFRFQLTDEELERILGFKPKDPLAAHIDWIITQVPPSPNAPITISDRFWERMDEALNAAMERVGVPQRIRPYVRRAARGTVSRGSGVILEEVMHRLGITDGEQLEAIRGAIDRLFQTSP